MCDLNQIFGILTAANTLLLAAIAACLVTIGLNLGIFTFMAAPAAFGIALAAALAANITFLPVINLLSGCTSGPCAANAREVIELLSVVAGSLAAGIATAYIAIIFLAAPVAGSGPVGIVSTCLVMASVYLMQAVTRLSVLQTCMAAPPPPTSSAVLITAGAALFLSLAGIPLFLLFSLGWDRNKKKKDSDSSQ